MSRPSTVYRGLEGQIVKQTDKAILFMVIAKDGTQGKQEWFPKSQLSSYGGTYDEVDGTFNYILASEWILGQNGLLSSSVPSALIKSDKPTPPIKAPAYGYAAKDVKQRLPYKDDEGSFDDYYDQLRNEDAGDRS